MNLSAPTVPVFWIAVVLAALALIGQFVAIPFFSANGFWVAIVAFVILAAGNMMKGM